MAAAVEALVWCVAYDAQLALVRLADKQSSVSGVVRSPRLRSS